MSAWKAGGVTQACDGLAKRCDEVRPAQVVDVLGSHLHFVCGVDEAMSAAEVAPMGSGHAVSPDRAWPTPTQAPDLRASDAKICCRLVASV